MTAKQVRPATGSQVREMSQVLARAFYDDPVMTWMLPDDSDRLRALTRVYSAMIRHHFLARQAVEISGEADSIGAAALWDPPGQWRHTPSEELRMMPSFLWAMRKNVSRGRAIAELMTEHHPEEPHWYLAVIRSDPEVRGRGYGQALMRSRLDRCDVEAAPAYLESSKESNVPYYKRFGFEVTETITLPDGGPTLWCMWRRPG